MTETPTNEDFMAAHINTLKEEISALRLALLLERERCAKVCEDAGPPRVERHEGTELEINAKMYAWYGLQFAAAIRARPDLCNLTEAREMLKDAHRYRDIRKNGIPCSEADFCGAPCREELDEEVDQSMQAEQQKNTAIAEGKKDG